MLGGLLEGTLIGQSATAFGGFKARTRVSLISRDFQGRTFLAPCAWHGHELLVPVLTSIIILTLRFYLPGKPLFAAIKACGRDFSLVCSHPLRFLRLRMTSEPLDFGMAPKFPRESCSLPFRASMLAHPLPSPSIDEAKLLSMS